MKRSRVKPMEIEHEPQPIDFVNKWRKISLAEALRHGKTRTICKSPDRFVHPPEALTSGELVYFTDGSAVYSHSNWSGPFSEVTPDIDPEVPSVWLYEPETTFS